MKHLLLLLSFALLSVSQHPDDLEAIYDFWKGLTTQSQELLQWDPQNFCNQKSIICNEEQRITNIKLSNMEITGTIPGSFGNLVELQTMELDGNYIYGNLPSKLSRLRELKLLKLDSNRLTGTIPSQLISISHHAQIYVSSNNFDCPAKHYYRMKLADDEKLVAQCKPCLGNPCQPEEICHISHNMTDYECRTDLACADSVFPSSGVPGSEVVVKGKWFRGSVASCFFGEEGPHTQGVVVDTETIICLVPPQRSSISEVSVVVKVDGIGKKCRAGFTYSHASVDDMKSSHGFHGEKFLQKEKEEVKEGGMENEEERVVARNSRSVEDVHKKTNHLFHLYCSKKISVIGLFEDNFKSIEKFWVRVGSIEMTLGDSDLPKVLVAHDQPVYIPETDSYRIDLIESSLSVDNHIEWDDSSIHIKYDYLKMSFQKVPCIRKFIEEMTPEELQNNSIQCGYSMDISVVDEKIEEQVTGIVGRTLHHTLSEEQFKKVSHFKASLQDTIHFSCSRLPLDTV